MFGLFNKNNDPAASNAAEWLPQIQENQQRFFEFLHKIELRMQELTDAAVPELTAMRNSSEESFKMDYQRMKSGIDGQLENIRKKVYDVHDEKVLDLYNEIKEGYSPKDHDRNVLDAFRSDCRNRYTLFEEKYQACSNAIDATDYEDYEIAYQKVLNEYAAIKDKFNCKQCGSPIAIEKIFFINVHLNCAACQTQNTFEPSTQAKMLQHFAQDLASQRAADLYNQYKMESEKERYYYHEMHPLKLSLNFEKNPAIIAETQAKIDDLEAKRQASILQTPLYRQAYLLKKFAEWKKITPDLADHLETRLQNELANIEQ